MKTINLILQGKGGVGKSLVSSLLYQYLLGKGYPVLGVDTDPVNNTLAAYKELNVTTLDIMKSDMDVDRGKLDQLMELVLNDENENRHFVVDNGAATFLPLCAWMRENQTIEMWRDAGMIVYLHSVVTGGQAQKDTLDGLQILMKYFDAPIVVWLNSYAGEISHTNQSGEVLTFEDFGIYHDYSERFAAVIRIPLKHPQTFGRDVENLLKSHQTFATATALNNPEFPVMTRQRLKIFWRECAAEIDKARLF